VRIARVPHRWRVTPRQARAIQLRLAARVRVTPLDAEPRLVAGVDSAFAAGACIAGAVLWDARTGEVVEQHVARRPLVFPYVPGLLSFREAPAILAALRKLRRRPDALLVDGHGLAHPRRFGIACHLGVLLGLPTAGCAKSRLVGEHGEPGSARGSRTPLVDGAERLGSVLRTRDGGRPIYVSVGHRIDLAGAERLVLACARGHRLPEPTHLADRLVAYTRLAHGTS
jgi:deoxyribonuclease V